jgi:hypothetical protein
VAIQNPLSVLTGVIDNSNNIPTLVRKITAIVDPKKLERQHLTKNNSGHAISKFANKIAGFYSSFFTYVENKAKADNHRFLLQLQFLSPLWVLNLGCKFHQTCSPGTQSADNYQTPIHCTVACLVST